MIGMKRMLFLKWRKFFQQSDVDVVHGSMQIIKEDGESFIKIASADIRNLKKGMLLNHPTVFAKHALYVKYGMFDTSYRIVADWEMMMRWWLNEVKFIGRDDTLAHFRMGGVSSEYLKKSFKEKHKVRKEHNLYNLMDWYYMYDKMKSVLPAEKLLNISLYRQKTVGK